MVDHHHPIFRRPLTSWRKMFLDAGDFVFFFLEIRRLDLLGQEFLETYPILAANAVFNR